MKKRKLIFNVAAQSGGAATVLNYYYEKAKKDRSTEYTFILGSISLNEASNIKVINYPWIKKSWVHRIFFDLFISRIIYKKENPDEVISLQNLRVLGINKKQTILIQNVLPFSDKKYKIYEDKKIWVYQNIMSKLIIKSLLSKDLIIVQNNWMKNRLADKYKINFNKIFVDKIDYKEAINIQSQLKKSSGNKIFFYPSSGLIYKNHSIIVKVCKILKENKIKNFEVIFTLTGNDNKHIKKLKKIIDREKLPIKFVGYLNKEDLNFYYKNSTLLFPSFIETIGLPLIECQHHASPIICSNYEYAKEVTNNYKYVKYFDPNDEKELYKLLKHELTNN